MKYQWHPAKVDCLALERTKPLTVAAFEATINSHSHSGGLLDLPITPLREQANIVTAKTARFEWETPRIEQETRAYQLLQGHGLSPRFLAHVHENGRVIGFLLEKMEGRPASIQDLSVCEAALGKLHMLGLVHGDVNRYNFLVTEQGAKLIDFERLEENAIPEAMKQELENLRAELVDESGRGGGFIFHGEN